MWMLRSSFKYHFPGLKVNELLCFGSAGGREVEPGALSMLDELLGWSPTPKDSNLKSKSNLFFHFFLQFSLL